MEPASLNTLDLLDALGAGEAADWEFKSARGGVSECRNKTLQKMFALLGVGERAGSGLDKIRAAWQAQNWRQPHMEETERPDRVRLVLAKISLVPEEALAALRHRWPKRLHSLSAAEVQALVTAQVETTVCNARIQEISTAHPADITKLLQKLMGDGFLEQIGQKRGAAYRIKKELDDSYHVIPEGTGVIPEGTGVIPGGKASCHSDEGPPAALREQLLLAAQPAAQGRLPESATRKIVLSLCAMCTLTTSQIATLLEKEPRGLRRRILKPLLAAGLLVWKYPQEPNRPDQAYQITPAGLKALAEGFDS